MNESCGSPDRIRNRDGKCEGQVVRRGVPQKAGHVNEHGKLFHRKSVRPWFPAYGVIEVGNINYSPLLRGSFAATEAMARVR